MTDQFAAHLQEFAQYATVWGFLAIIVLMAIESSFIPFPSEVVMIPAGFMAARGDLTCHIPALDLLLALVAGLAGALLGAYVNYFLALKLGEPFFRKYGKYLLVSPQTLDRAQEIFRKYGDAATFVCRLLPAIRQLISLPAGLARMDFKRFTLFTALGAGIWNAILAGTGFYFGHRTRDLGYPELIRQGKELIQHHYGWILAAIAIFLAAYFTLQHFVMKRDTPDTPQEN